MLKYIIQPLLLLFICAAVYPQKLEQVRKEKVLIIEALKKNKADLEKAIETLELLSPKSLRLFLKDKDIPSKNKSKKELIDLIINNVKFILGKKKERFIIKSGAGTRRTEIQKLVNPNKEDERYRLTYSTEYFIKTDEKDEKGHTFAFLFGNVELEFRSKTLKADACVIKFDENNDPIEAMAVGDILIEDENQNRIRGEKVYYWPQNNRAKIFKAQAHRKPFYLTGDQVKLLSDNKYVMNQGMMTSCNIRHPHYQLKYKKAWVYDEEYLWAEDVEYQIGHTTLLTTPFFFRSLLTTGIQTAFGYEPGIDWFLHNTFAYVPGKNVRETRNLIDKGAEKLELNGQGMGMKVKFDYYQKMGLYLGYEFLYKDGIDRIFFDSAVAYDRALKYVGGDQILTNYFDQDGDGTREESNNIRWRILFDSKFALFKSSGINSLLTIKFKNQGEPYFQSQFETRRKIDFDLWDILGIDETNAEVEGASASSFGSTTGQQFHTSLSNKIGGFSVSISGYFDYVLQRDNTDPSNPPTNPFKTNSYKNYKSIFTVPQIRIAYTDYIQVLGNDKPRLESDESRESQKRDKELENFVKEIKRDDSYETEEEAKKREQEEKEFEEEQNEKNFVGEDSFLTPEVKRKNRVVVNLPITYKASLDFSEVRSYSTTSSNDLQSDIFNTTGTFTVSTPFTLTYKFIEWNVNTTESIQSLRQKTKNATSTQKNTDDELTYELWKSNLSSNLELHFFDEYEYLELIIGGGVRYSKSNRFDKIVSSGGSYKKESGRSETLGFDSSITFLKTKLSMTFTDNLYISGSNRDKITAGTASESDILREQQGNLILTAESEAFDFLKLSNTFIRSRKDNIDLSNEFTLSYKLFNRERLFGSVYLNKISHTISWYKDFQNTRASYLNSVFSIDFNISRNWNFIYQASSSNKELYRYSQADSSRYGQESRNILQDLLDSFDFSDQSKRENSLFNLESMSFILRHDLHDWMFEFSLDLYVKQYRNGPYYFEPTIYFIIYLKEMPSFKYPKVNHTFTKE